MTWLVIILGFALFLLAGIYVVSGQWGAARPARDAKAIARWRKTERRGFWLHVIRDGIPAGFLFIFGRAWLDAWSDGLALAMTTKAIVTSVVLSITSGFILGALDWRWRRAAAAEALERAERIHRDEK